MAIKNTLLGGTDWSDTPSFQILNGQDMYDTFEALVNKVQLNGKFNVSLSYGNWPKGTILMWAKSIAGVPQTLPTGWQEADGTNGTPNLNGNNYFLRGINGTTGSTAGTLTHNHTQAYTPFEMTGHNVYAVNIGSSSNVPSYYDFVFIIKTSTA